jgi:hypothetical protein
MASIISAGTTSGTALNMTGDTSGQLQLQTNGTTTALTIDTSQNVGIGTTSPGAKLGITAGTLGTTAGSQIKYQILGSSDVGNGDFLEITNTRETAGSSWTGAGSRLQQKVDATYMGYVQFNGGTGTTNDAGISFGTGTSASATGILERMRINSAGAVTKPYQPAFFASSTAGTVSISTGSYLAFNTLVTTFAGSNRNGGYNTSTYLYTAPVAGLYFFYIQGYINPNSATSSFSWWKNGSQLAYADVADNIYIATNSSTTPSNIILNGSVTLELAAGDYVGVQVRTGFGAVSIYMNHSTYFGYLIG